MASEGSRQKRGLTFAVRHAEQPAQTLNIDIAFIPLQHQPQEPLPAVSGSSGQLRVAPVREIAPPSHPGQVFAQGELEYAEAMNAFVAASPPRQTAGSSPASTQEPDAGAARRAAAQAADRLRVERRELRLSRQREDLLWQQLRDEERHSRLLQSPAEAERKRQAWLALRRQRSACLRQREREDALWRAARSDLRRSLTPDSPPRQWLAVLMVVDNCTRQCLGLPLFESGAKLTAQEVSTALGPLLPSELEFVVTDRGTHFTATAFAELLTKAELVHVLTARHRPQSNGIAERSIQTMKEWLEEQSWTNAAEVRELLAAFLAEYNERPHQGLPLPGLSPNEFARRIWLL